MNSSRNGETVRNILFDVVRAIGSARNMDVRSMGEVENGRSCLGAARAERASLVEARRAAM
jgi:hypothetical protein